MCIETSLIKMLIVRNGTELQYPSTVFLRILGIEKKCLSFCIYFVIHTVSTVRVFSIFHSRTQRWGQGVQTPTPPEKSQKYRVS